ncbi:hypothetical protein M2146_001166 [Lachnospiraceae bacterium PF1-22]
MFSAIFWGVYVIFMLAVIIISTVAFWKLYEKAGIPGWKIFIPFYNQYLLYQILWGNGWYFLLTFIPLGGLVFQISSMFRMAKAFGKETGFGFGLLFLSIIFLPILAFGDAEYRGPETPRKGLIVAAGVLGGLYVILYVILAAIGLGSAVGESLRDTMAQTEALRTEQETNPLERDWEDEWNEKQKAREQDSDLKFTTVSLENSSGITKDVKVIDNLIMEQGNAASSGDKGINTTVMLTDMPSSQQEDAFKEYVSNMVGLYEGTDSYQNMVTSEITKTKSGKLYCEVTYDYYALDTAYPCLLVFSAEDVDGYVLVTLISMDSSIGQEDLENNLYKTLTEYDLNE